MSIKYFDMFSGIGGFRSGLDAVGGFECIGHCEIDKYANLAYNSIYRPKGEIYFEDARTINPTELPHIDLICAGFPCQSFSIAGKRLGFNDDTRGTLFFEIARIVAVKRPTFLLLENVPGLLWQLAGIYADEGISGTRADKRTEFQRMIKDCHAGKIDYIITKSVSRFARNTVDCLETVRMLKAMGIGIFFEEQNIDTLKSDSELYLVIYAGFAQSESESISKNITWSFRKNFEYGKCIFMYKKWLGYKKGEDGEPEIVPYEAEIVERIYDMYLGGQTTRMISETLKAENIEIPGKSFTFSSHMIENILKNEKYCGDCILQKTVTVDCISKTRKANEGEAPMYMVQNNHPAIIDRKTFNRVQEEMSRRNAITPQSPKKALTASGKHSKYALTEVLKCGECGSKYRRCTWTSHGKKRIVWRCINRLDNGTKYCTDSLTILESSLHQAIVRALKQFDAEDEVTYLTLMKATIGEAIGLNGGTDEIDLLQRQIDALNKRMVTLATESVQNNTSFEENEAEYKEISEQITQLGSRITAITDSLARDNSRKDRLQRIQEIIAQRKIDSDTYDDAIVRQMIECIEVFKDGTLLIHFGGGYEIEEHIQNDCNTDKKVV